MLLINLAISLFSILKVKTSECVSVINKKCMSRPKIINLNADEPNVVRIIFWCVAY